MSYFIFYGDSPNLTCRRGTRQDWRTWKNSHGVTSAVRTHLKKYHEATYCAVVRAEKLKGWERLDSTRRTDSESVSASPPKPFSLDEFNRKLVRWIVVDDQVRLLNYVPVLTPILIYTP